MIMVFLLGMNGALVVNTMIIFVAYSVSEQEPNLLWDLRKKDTDTNQITRGWSSSLILLMCWPNSNAHFQGKWVDCWLGITALSFFLGSHGNHTALVSDICHNLMCGLSANTSIWPCALQMLLLSLFSKSCVLMPFFLWSPCKKRWGSGWQK